MVELKSTGLKPNPFLWILSTHTNAHTHTHTHTRILIFTHYFHRKTLCYVSLPSAATCPPLPLLYVPTVYVPLLPSLCNCLHLPYVATYVAVYLSFMLLFNLLQYVAMQHHSPIIISYSSGPIANIIYLHTLLCHLCQLLCPISSLLPLFHFSLLSLISASCDLTSALYTYNVHGQHLITDGNH